MEIEKILRSHQGTVVDVRTRGEFTGGHVAGSVNIPLTELPENLEKLKSMQSPIILCCASGMRSAQAENFLNREGLDCVNGGSWLEVNYLQSKAS
ncbi:rhodanese-like domain-containing protein [Salinimicrobium sp. CAU 1759]